MRVRTGSLQNDGRGISVNSLRWPDSRLQSKNTVDWPDSDLRRMISLRARAVGPITDYADDTGKN